VFVASPLLPIPSRSARELVHAGQGVEAVCHSTTADPRRVSILIPISKLILILLLIPILSTNNKHEDAICCSFSTRRNLLGPDGTPLGGALEAGGP